MDWQPINTAPNKLVVETKIDDQDGVRNIQPLKRDVSPWISVEERLPEKEGDYLTWGYTRRPHVGKFSTLQQGQRFSTPVFATNVTHWCEIPKSPSARLAGEGKGSNGE